VPERRLSNISVEWIPFSEVTLRPDIENHCAFLKMQSVEWNAEMRTAINGPF